MDKRKEGISIYNSDGSVTEEYKKYTEDVLKIMQERNNPPIFNGNEEWISISKSSHGELYASKNGDTIIVGTWDGTGMKYDVHFRNEKAPQD